MSRPQVDVNLFDRAVVENPYELYEQIRAAGRVVWNDVLQAWMLTGFNECSQVLTDSGERFAMMNDNPELTPWFEAPNMIMVDGAEHVRLRRGLAPLFTRQAVAKWETRIGEVVEQLLTPLIEGRESFDLIAEFTMIPTIIVADMLGVPAERYDDFQRWSHAITSNIAYGHEDAITREVMAKATVEVNAYIREEIERHRRESLDDVLSFMLTMPELTEEEIQSTALVFLLAGYDTTAKLMSNCLVALEANPDQKELVVGDLSLLPATIEEVFRWMGVTQMVPRKVMTELTLAGTDLQPGDILYTMVEAANRDPGRWPDPLRFDVRREQKSHLGLGFGPHLCIGAPLARLETRIALERLLTIAPEYELRGIDYGSGLFVRGPEEGFLDIKLPSAT
jgi:cytochrome P450